MFDEGRFRLPAFSEVSFAHPWVFWLLCIIPLLVIWYVRRHHHTKPELTISGLSGFVGNRKSAVVRLMHLPFVFRCISIALIIIALARPQTRLSVQDMNTMGIDILLTMDLSASMLAKDFKPNRLESAKSVAIEFIDSRPSDRIGLVVFSGEAYTQCPLTIDHSVLKNLLSTVEPNFLADGTAIGMGLATAVNRLRESKSAGKVIILITDGENNVGSVSPLTAAEIAREFGIRLYTIGVGSRGMAYSPVTRVNGEYVFGYTEVRIDEALLTKMAEMTQGQYFRATNHEGLKAIYKQIDQLEKTRFDVKEYRKKKEEFWPLALLAVMFVVAEWLMRNTLMRSIP
ncbi:MAG: VWA domain-containing protein [Bacteroidia bacterium]|nr:VWA domain-containing protein [Bacteroidia bacterium]MCC6768251.1 VWA domain-containing protein [Bacteroidia bacterium]